MPDTNLDRLLTVARRQDGDPDRIWPAALAAVGLLLWRDDVAAARELTVETIARFGRSPARMAARSTPVIDALVAGFDSISADGLDGDDHYRIVLWPDADRAPEVLKRCPDPVPGG